MKKGLGLLSLMFIALFAVSFASAVSSSPCDLQISLLNQDPYPAVPGDYVKLVFQIQGAQNPQCQDILFELVPQYPISFDPNVSSQVQIKAGSFVSDYSNNILVPFKVRLDSNAIDGDNPIRVRYYVNQLSTNHSYLEQQVTLNVKDVKTIFEAFVKNFDPATNILTVQVLNSGKSNIDALTIEIPQQDNFAVKGSNKNIVGSLDSNEYTTADFEVVPVKGNILLNLYYTDEIGVRRQTNTTVPFDPLSFEGRKSQQTSSSFWIYVLVIIILIIVYVLYRRNKKQKQKKLHLN